MSNSTETANFSFEHKGETYTFEHSLAAVRRPGWLRKNRRRDEIDLAFTILEEVAGDEVLDVVDDMDEDEFAALMQQLDKALNASFQ